MAIIFADGLFHGDRFRHCSNAAQLHWPRLFLASNTLGRLEINYHRIVADAYETFRPVPTIEELRGYILEYYKNYLMFVYDFDGQYWGQWDVKEGSLPRHKKKADLNSPAPDPTEFERWKKSYRFGKKGVAVDFRNSSEEFLLGIGIGVGIGVGKAKASCSSGDERVVDDIQTKSLTLNPNAEVVEVDRESLRSLATSRPSLTGKQTALFDAPSVAGGCDIPVGALTSRQRLEKQQREWFGQWWSIYWRKVAKKAARKAFMDQIRTQAEFERVMAATLLQSPGMLARDPDKRPHGATWLNGERWEDEAETVAVSNAFDSLWEQQYGKA